MIEVVGLSKTFEDNLSLFMDISISIKKGELVSILGPSGSGKSTLLRCIIGLDNIYEGTINIGGVENINYLKEKRVAVVLQKYPNFQWLSAYDNISVAFHKMNIDSNRQEEITREIIKDMGLEGFENYYMNKLSGGMQQRVAVARALAQDTDIVAFDEPFGALDLRIRENLQILIKRINMSRKKTMLFITHDVEEALFLSHRIVVLSKPPNTSLRVFETAPLRAMRDMDYDDPAQKYRKEFLELRKDIESFLGAGSNHTNRTN